MSSKTKIVVLKSKELIYTGIFIVLGIMLILLLFYMFSPGEEKSKDKESNSNTINNNEEVTESITTSPTTESGEFDESIPMDDTDTTQETVISETENLEAEYLETENSETENLDDEDLETVASIPSSQTNEANTYTETTVQDNSNSETFSGYVPGVYTSELNLGGSTILLSVSVDESQVTGVSMDNMDETLTAMYPLVQPSLDEINSQIGLVSSVEDITYSADNKYTTILILDAIDEALDDARK